MALCFASGMAAISAAFGVTTQAGGFNVASFQIEDDNGPLQMLCVESHRTATPHIAQFARQLDPECIYVINDIRTFSRPLTMTQQPTGWRSILKKK